ncbi:MAG: ankyrin repeat domain-containing protein [Candidatus Babeliales bacterium]
MKNYGKFWIANLVLFFFCIPVRAMEQKILLDRSLLKMCIDNNDKGAYACLSLGANPNTIRDTHNNTPLHWAVMHNNSHLVELLLRNHSQVYLKNNDGKSVQSLLHVYASNSAIKKSFSRYIMRGSALMKALGRLNFANILNFASIMQLIDTGSSVNFVSEFGLTPLMLAAECGDLEILEVLIARGADIDRYRGQAKETAFIFAVKNNNTECAQALLQAGAEFSPEYYLLYLCMRDTGKSTDYATITALLESGINPNGVTDADRNTPLHYAMIHDNNVLVELLFCYGASLYQKNRFLKNARFYGNKKSLTLQKILSKQSKLGKEFFEHIIAGCEKEAQIILDQGLNSNYVYDSLYGSEYTGMTPLMIAARHGAVATLEKLITKGALINWHKQGGTALIEALAHNQTGAAQLLLDHGADVKRAPFHGTVAKEMIRLENVAMLQWIITKRPDLATLRNPLGSYIAWGRVSNSNIPIIRVLIAAGADVNEPFRNSTPLNWVSQQGNGPLIRELLNHNARIMHDSNGQTALNHAIERGNISIMSHMFPQ